MVFGAHLQITGLKAKSGPGVEFLEYITPPGGRPYPENSEPWDLWHWHTHIQVADIDLMYQKLKKDKVSFISEGLIEIRESHYEFDKAFMVRDVDGHAVLISN